jgi:hypothetical protein
LSGIHRRNGGFSANMIRQRELHQNAIHCGIRVEPGDFSQKRRFAGAGGQVDGGTIKPRFKRGAILVAHINAAGGILTHAHHA